MMTLVRTSGISLCLLCLACTYASAQQIRYVDAEGPGAGDGSSWTQAFTDLGDALASALVGDEVWVAEGTYRVDANASPYRLMTGISVFGGFEAGAGNRDDRDPSNHPVVLTVAEGIASSIISTSGTDRSAVLDGFIIEGGEGNVGGGLYNQFGSPTLRNLIFRQNTAARGAGMASVQGNPLLINCVFVDNEATTVGTALGGALYVDGGSIAVFNSQFKRNRAFGRGSDEESILGIGRGGAVYVSSARAVFVNALFAENSAEGEPYTSGTTGRVFKGYADGGGVYSRSSSLSIVNSTLVNNSLPTTENVNRGGGGLVADGGGGSLDTYDDPYRSGIRNSILWGNDLEQVVGVRVEYSIVEAGYPGYFVYQFDPQLSESYELRRYSFAIDAGRTNSLPVDSLDFDGDGDTVELLPVDASGGPRVSGQAVDLGWLENRDPFTPPEDDYFPVELGNSWTYYHLHERRDAPPDTAVGLPRAVVDTFTVDGLLYYRMPYPEALADSIRNDGEGRVFARFRGKEVLLFDFTLGDGAQYTFVRSEAVADTFVVTVDRNVTVDVKAGHFENCIRLTFDIPLALDDTRTYFFAPGVGIVMTYDGMGEASYLHEAVVGEKVIEKPKRYYPLAIGNSWTYRTMTLSVIDTISVNSRLYHLVETTYQTAFEPSSHVDTLREDSQGRVWMRWRGVDELWYDFGVADGATYESHAWSVFPGEFWTVTASREINLDVPAGSFEGCVRLFFDIIEAADDERGVVSAPGVGIVRIYETWVGNQDLVSAVVGNRVITVEQDVPTSIAAEAVAYPNPFRESTTLLFPNTGSTVAIATVYDVLGRTVAKLSTYDCSLDSCAFRWDGGDASNGLYFVISDEASGEIVSVVLAR